jgi:hypothetical protein
VIHRREKLHKVTLQHVPVASGKWLAAIQGSVGAPVHPASVTVVNKSPLKDRLDLPYQGVMHHSVPERCRADASHLGLPQVRKLVS